LEHGLGDYLSDVLVRNISGSYIKNITNQLQPAGFGPIDWSPTGKYFAFSGVTEPFIYLGKKYYSDGYWARNMYIANADGSSLQKLPGGPFQGYEHNKAWSPNGKRLAFLTEKGFAIINADGSGFLEYLIDQNFGDRQIFWADNGEYLTFTDANDSYYRIKPDFSGLEELAFATDIDKMIYRFKRRWCINILRPTLGLISNRFVLISSHFAAKNRLILGRHLQKTDLCTKADSNS
jgi:hypothetical protein